MSDTAIAIVGGFVFLLAAGGLTLTIQEFDRPGKAAPAKGPSK